MKLVVTGAAGFLGWHTLARIGLTDGLEGVAIDRTAFSSPAFEEALRSLTERDAILHLAGINRASEDEVEHGNVALAERVVEAHRATGCRARIIVAGSAQADLVGTAQESPYGRGKLAAAQLLAAYGEQAGVPVTEVRLPNLYGEHGRPAYNSFVATFAHRIAAGEAVEVTGDREIPLQHVQDAAADLLAAATSPQPPALVRPTTAVPLRIGAVAELLRGFHESYARGEIPQLRDRTEVRLFNVLRAAMWDQGVRSFPLTPHADARGAFVEILRQHGGSGQSSFSTTVPGITRGDHLHLRKIERFVVVRGTGVIRLRKAATDELVEIPVSGDAPTAVDMPTLWTHSITNTGEDEMLTLFWINEMYDPADADTFFDKVLR